MSGIRTWALSMISGSQLRAQQDKTKRKSVSVQTLLSASSSAEVSKEWLFRNDKDVDIDFLGNENTHSDDDDDTSKIPQYQIRRKRVPDKPNNHLNLWSMLKDLIGQNITNVALPVNINEPLTVLQRMAETFESSSLLDQAAESENVYDQIAYLAAFAISSYAVSAERTGKPFNPLLGETYECDRTGDLGWRCLVEQVSHHPSMSALHCESEKWIFWEDLTAELLFRGKYIRFVPNDYRYVKFKCNQKTYRISRPETVIHNIVVGKVWIDHCGKVEIICLDDTVHCTLSFVPYSNFSRNNQRIVTGEVYDESKVQRLIRGNWDSKIDIASNLEDESGELSATNASFETVWERTPPKPESSKYYNMSEFACELNELELFVAPTDSRLRPDLRLMEEAKWEEANAMKLRLEGKQRRAICERETANAALLIAGVQTIRYKPTWFAETKMPFAGIDQTVYRYIGGYWEAKRNRDWSMCPDIFS